MEDRNLALLTILKELHIKTDIVLGLFCCGFIPMVSTYLSNIGLIDLSTDVMGFGIGLFVLLLLGDFIFVTFRPVRKLLSVPIMFTEQTNNTISSSFFNNFIRYEENLVNTFEEINKRSGLNIQDLIISFNCPNPRISNDIRDWISARNEMLQEWEKIDKIIIKEPYINSQHCYHLVPHIPLPLAFSLGASVNTRRPLVLYHHQDINSQSKEDINSQSKVSNKMYYDVINLNNPKEIFKIPDPSFFLQKNISLNVVTEMNGNMVENKKLILHIIVVPNHNQNFQSHPDNKTSDNIALIYQITLEPTDDWLPYVQQIVQKASPLISNYQDVEICLRCPDVIAFALGIAFSRNPSLKVCVYCTDSTYRPVFSLSEIEHKLSFS